MKTSILYVYLAFIILVGCHQNKPVVILEDGFEHIRRGPIGGGTTAHTEYQYMHEAAPRSKWEVSTFRYNLYNSWFIRKVDGKNVLWQKHYNKDIHWHPMVVSGDRLWRDYTINASFSPLSKEKQSGVVFRYQHDRCYYFFGVMGDTAMIKMVKHGVAFRQPYEKILAMEKYAWDTNFIISAKIKVAGNTIEANLINGPTLSTTDTTYKTGKVGFLADVPTFFHAMEITTSQKEYERIAWVVVEREKKENALQASNPKMKVWKKISTEGFGVARNLRFGDMNGDGETDVLVGQVVHHGHKDRNSELSCLTAITLDGEILWQKGKPDLWKNHLTNDVAFQIHDINNDGKNEVVYTMNQELVIADAFTGKIVKKVPTPLTPGGKPTSSGHNIFHRILGDCLYFCDFDGNGRDDEFILKDRYRYLWAYNNTLQVLWHNECVTGHYPYAYDVDRDGKDELAMGYTLFDDNGTKLWTFDDTLKDHADAVAILPLKKNEEPVFICAASDEGMFFANLDGEILKHHYIGHVQNPGMANLRDDLPGLETVSVNYWGNQGIFHFFDASGNIYADIEPNQYGSVCLPLNWTGNSEEYFIINANVDEGGAYDGWGRKVLNFPDDGHPDMCYAVLDITGDCRDEIVVWDPYEIWVYTQDDNPKEGKLYKPERNPLYNYSNYQATVSLPGWKD